MHGIPITAILANTRNTGIRGVATVCGEISTPLSQNHPPTGAAPDHALGGNDNLQNGTPRELSAALQPDTPLRGVGPGGSGDLDRRAKTGVPIRKGAPNFGTGREATHFPPGARSQQLSFTYAVNSSISP